ncbi:hypothetical protein [Chromobacterium haemolyticum]|uniref:hypothetical protein n=1 Tax=Chromobacterium haemolyticum TaxID=394935 RepID=UPI001746695A|nr:hypothetical protein [Chromobacterium haemolyticum]QOD84913.1 hypothetical protein IEZ30_10710 [Chromobacterium haemolyticum]
MEFSNSFILRCNLETLIFKALAIKSFEGGLINPSKNLSIRLELIAFSKKLETPNPEKKAKKKTVKQILINSKLVIGIVQLAWFDFRGLIKVVLFTYLKLVKLHGRIIGGDILKNLHAIGLKSGGFQMRYSNA